MKNDIEKMRVDTLRKIMDKLIGSGGKTVFHGARAYRIHADDHAKWLMWLPLSVYRDDSDLFEATPIGWYAVLRLA